MELQNSLEFTAKALRREYELDEDILDKYYEQIPLNSQTESKTILFEDLLETQGTIIEMCAQLRNSEEIMQHIQNSIKMISVWYPD